MTESREEVLRNIAANVRALCEEKGWSFGELARQAGEPTNTVVRMANAANEVGIFTALRVAAALGTTVDRLRMAPKKSPALA